MTKGNGSAPTLVALDEPTRELIRLAAWIAVGTEAQLRSSVKRAAETRVEPMWVEEILLQSYLFAGFPRALNAAREWRKASGLPAPATNGDLSITPDELRARGEETCAEVYGPLYARLRVNIRALHPVLDSWMVVEGYGKVLSRPALDLQRRELCIVAVCAVSGQERQLHSHLLGALNVGASPEAIDATLDVIEAMCPADGMARIRKLWKRVQKK
ncbi:MAG: carboxymuconolactone decarboxylase family protein [Anaerolineae bacterium]|nr:carboxymuconolactone decarboxylase family protein [Gemmatimonadaceae bacterium]